MAGICVQPDTDLSWCGPRLTATLTLQPACREHPLRRFVRRLIQRYWRLSRGLTMGAQGIVVAPGPKILLVRHGYRSGWHLPGGGVEFNETALAALYRELEEEAGVVPAETPCLHGIFGNFEIFPGDHVAVYVVRAWDQPSQPKPGHEIVETRFFGLDELPENLAAGARRRLAEVFEGKPRGETW
ncbi:MAG: NUDIX domain-containing protein [Hyphomicrobiaceae bacterium]|nr:MAG: NUDIX domain-containing protein [Hyphomicrobiaceae bacterium]